MSKQPTYRPRADLVLLRRIQVGSGRIKTINPIYERFAEVVAVGPDVEGLEPGDRVHGAAGLAQLVDKSQDLFVADQKDVWCVVEGGEGIKEPPPPRPKQVVGVKGPLPSMGPKRQL